MALVPKSGPWAQILGAGPKFGALGPDLEALGSNSEAWAKILKPGLKFGALGPKSMSCAAGDKALTTEAPFLPDALDHQCTETPNSTSVSCASRIPAAQRSAAHGGLGPPWGPLGPHGPPWGPHGVPMGPHGPPRPGPGRAPLRGYSPQSPDHFNKRPEKKVRPRANGDRGCDRGPCPVIFWNSGHIERSHSK